MVTSRVLSEPNICEKGVEGYKTFNIGIAKLANTAEDEEQWECQSFTVKNPTTAVVVAEFTNNNLVLTDKEKAAVMENCELSLYNVMVSAIIKARYPEDEMDAVRNNYDRVRDGKAGDKTEAYTTEYEAMQDWRDHAKEVAKEYMIGNDD